MPNYSPVVIVQGSVFDVKRGEFVSSNGSTVPSCDIRVDTPHGGGGVQVQVKGDDCKLFDKLSKGDAVNVYARQWIVKKGANAPWVKYLFVAQA